MPKVSVIMPVYNAGKYLRETIDSILGQTYADFEFLIFNDASTDDSLSIIKSYTDNRIFLTDSAVNTGYVKHLNDGIRKAKGKYIARMDADDIAFPERFAKQVEFMETHSEVGVCGSMVELIGDKKGIHQLPVTDKDILTWMLMDNNAMAHPSVMIRKSVLEKENIFYDLSLRPSEDYAMWLKISEHSELYNLPIPLLKYRVHASSESNSNNNRQRENAARIQSGFLYQLLHINESTEEALLLKDFIIDRKVRKVSVQEFNIIHKGLQKLVFNSRINVELLKNMIGDLYYRFTYINTGLGPLVYFRFIQSKLVTISFKASLKLAIRSFLLIK